MLTQVKSPHEVFYMPQRLLVPLFQRPYVWSLESQWAPLWDDVRRLADRAAARQPVARHFLGAVVMQQQFGLGVDTLPIRILIDGQQRLTTLQLLLDAVHAELAAVGATAAAAQIEPLVANPEGYWSQAQDRFKVWPTNRDRAAFEAVMSAEAPVDYSAIGHSSSRMVQAHAYFSEVAREWLHDGPDLDGRAQALTQAVTSMLQIVVIELQPDEDAQEIFETLNARGTPLTAADLIKNFVFQRLEASPSEVEAAYQAYWHQFETTFWEREVTTGRLTYPRSSLFLAQWLISQTGWEITAREVFAAFKRYCIDGSVPMTQLLPRLKIASDTYRKQIEQAEDPHGPLDRLCLFLYRSSTLESEVFRPVVMWLTDPERPAIPVDQLDKALSSLESWMVRRALIRANTSNYNKVMLDLLTTLRQTPQAEVGDAVESFLRSLTSENSHWPADEEVRRELTPLPVYRRLRRARLRMVLEAVEDHLRGWDSGKPLHEGRVVRGLCTIEHVMPVQWATNWPFDGDAEARDQLVHRLGNLTLVTQALNSKASNAGWSGPKGKRDVLDKHTSILMTRELLKQGSNGWTDEDIVRRTEALVDAILDIWPVPEGHVGLVAPDLGHKAKYKVTLRDLIDAGLLETGAVLHARPQAYTGRTCQVTEDGLLRVGDEVAETPSGAGKLVTGHGVAGWGFWLLDADGSDRLDDLRRQYAEERGLIAGDAEDDD
jgi:hypothetical protein